MLTISLCSLAFRNDPIELLIPRIAQIGYDAVEIVGGHIDGKSAADLRALRCLAERHNLQITALSPNFAFTQTAQAYADSLERARRFIGYAHQLGCSRIRTFTDCGPGGINSRTATADHWACAVRGLRELTALDRGIDFLLETHPFTVADTLDSIRRLLHEVSAANLKVLYQPSNPSFCSMGIIQAWRQLAPYTTHMHLSNVNSRDHEGYIEKGELDLAGFVRTIQSDGYSGSVSVEYCWGDVPWERVESAFQFIAANRLPLR